MVAYLVVAADIDQERSGGLRREGLLRREADEPRASRGEKIIDRAAHVRLSARSSWGADGFSVGAAFAGAGQRVAATTSPLAAVSAATAPIAASAETRSVRMPAASAPTAKPKSRQKR